MFKKLLASLLLAFMALISMPAWAGVEINQATTADLQSIKGIGPKTATAIVEERKKGNYKDWPDVIKRVKSIGNKNATKLSAGGLTVNGKAYESKK